MKDRCNIKTSKHPKRTSKTVTESPPELGEGGGREVQGSILITSTNGSD